MKQEKIELGNKVRCKITGYTGIATAKTEFLNGCVQYEVTAKIGKDNKLLMEGNPGIDEQSLEVIKSKKKKIKKDDNGGPMRRGIMMRGY